MLSSGSASHGFVLKTKDLEEAASLLGDAAIPYVSELLPGSPPFSSQIFVTAGHRVSLSRVATTGSMRIQSGLPSDSYALVLDLGSGLGLHRTQAQTVDVNSDFAFVQSPLQSVEILSPPNFEALFLRFSRDAVVDELQKLLGRQVRTELLFFPAIRLNSAAGRRLCDLWDQLRRLLYTTDQCKLHDSLPLRGVEDELVALLLQTQPHNYTRLLNRHREAGAWQLDAAEQYMRGNAHLSLSLGDICQAAGVNAPHAAAFFPQEARLHSHAIPAQCKDGRSAGSTAEAGRRHERHRRSRSLGISSFRPLLQRIPRALRRTSIGNAAPFQEALTAGGPRLDRADTRFSQIPCRNSIGAREILSR